MPRTPRNPGSGKPPHNGSAKGAGAGDGWGGNSKGDGSKLAGPGRLTAELQAIHDGAKEARISALRANLLYLAFGAEREETRLSATNAALDREEGKAVAKQEISGSGGGPVMIRKFFMPPVDEPSEE